ncbi:related to Potential protein lysine methyltransferase SET5 [Pseudozyma flocculosa]|uniref:Histone-lysine N-methyltransferase SET5 n=1 Tax=Pseudozyma flocculosa TaxID=84751 RepID=A0A5C3F092_9BASI|nr:related to Potential protein lysine methyltransferase SET5 [Pseudozyma flocculosa]
MSAVPTEEQVASAAKRLLDAHSAAAADPASSSSTSSTAATEELGTAKLLTILQLENDWQLSEKRLKTILTRHGLRHAPAAPPASNGANGEADPAAASSATKKKKKPARKAQPSHVPRSYIDPSLNFPPGVEGHYFDAVKGKGLVATQDFDEGDVVFQEEAFVPTPPPSAVESMSRGMSTHHALLCTGSNPSVKPLMDLIQSQGWQSLHSVARSLARLLLTHSSTPPPSIASTSTTNPTPASFDEVYSQLSSFATVSELERRARNPGWSMEEASFNSALQSAHKALRAGLDPFDEERTKQRQTPGVKPEPFPLKVDEISASSALSSKIKELFSYPNFLALLGRSNVNMESHGGLYLLHSFLNHDCRPNIKIRHVPVRGRYASMKIAAVTSRKIKKGEELTISYVDPATVVRRRRMVLWRDYCFGPCACARCAEEVMELNEDERRESEKPEETTRKEEEELKKKQVHAVNGPGGKSDDKDLSGLEDELRDTLGF